VRLMWKVTEKSNILSDDFLGFLPQSFAALNILPFDTLQSDTLTVVD